MPMSQKITAIFQTYSQYQRGFFAALITALCAVVVLQATPAQAQSATSTQTVSARVLNTDGQGIQNATLVAQPLDTSFETLRATTDASGRFTLTLARDVTYEITTSANNYKTLTTYFRPQRAAAADSAAPAADTSGRNDEWFLLTANN